MHVSLSMVGLEPRASAVVYVYLGRNLTDEVGLVYNGELLVTELNEQTVSSKNASSLKQHFHLLGK